MQSLWDLIKSWFTTTSVEVLKLPTYVVTKVSDGEYDVAVSLPAVGTQHYNIKFDAVNDTFILSGKVAIIGPDAVFPISAFSEIINSTFQSWISSDPTVEKKLIHHRQMLIKKYDLTKKH